MSECDKCKGRNFIDDGSGELKQCPCVTTRAVKAFLPDIFRKYKIVKKGFDVKQFDKNLVYRTKLATFGTFINTFLTHKFLRNNQYTYSMVTVSAFCEEFFAEESNRYYESDLLVLMVYGGYKNKAAPQWLNALLKDRELSDLNTIVFVDKTDFPDSKVTEYYGDGFLNHINTFTKIN